MSSLSNCIQARFIQARAVAKKLLRADTAALRRELKRRRDEDEAREQRRRASDSILDVSQQSQLHDHGQRRRSTSPTQPSKAQGGPQHGWRREPFAPTFGPSTADDCAHKPKEAYKAPMQPGGRNASPVSKRDKAGSVRNQELVVAIRSLSTMRPSDLAAYEKVYDGGDEMTELDVIGKEPTNYGLDEKNGIMVDAFDKVDRGNYTHSTSREPSRPQVSRRSISPDLSKLFTPVSHVHQPSLASLKLIISEPSG